MALVFCTATWTGFSAAAKVRQTLFQLRQLKLSLEVMRCEIAYRLTPIRKLSGLLAESCKGELSRFYTLLGEGLLHGDEVTKAAEAAKRRCRALCLPPEIAQSMDELFACFGSYDYSGQLRLIELTQSRVEAAEAQLASEKKSRCRCYEVLGVCTGLALVILVA